MNSVAHPEPCGRHHEIALAEIEGCIGDVGVVTPPNGGNAELVPYLEIRNGDPVRVFIQRHLDDLDVTSRERDVILELLFDDALVDHVGSELCPRDIGDVERPVGISPTRLIEPRERTGNSEDLFGELDRHDIRIVRIRHCHKGIREFDPRLFEYADVYRSPVVGGSVERRSEGFEHPGPFIDDRDIVALLGKVQRQGTSDAPASGDDDSRSGLQRSIGEC